MSLSSILVFLPPFFYFYSHNLFFPKIYGFYIKEKLRCLNAETDARIAGLYDGSVLAVTGSTSQDLRAIYVNYENGIVQSIKDTLRHYDMLGILFIAIKLMTLRFFHWIRLKYYNFLNYKVGFIALIGRYGRFIRYNNKKNKIK